MTAGQLKEVLSCCEDDTIVQVMGDFIKPCPDAITHFCLYKPKNAKIKTLLLVTPRTLLTVSEKEFTDYKTFKQRKKVWEAKCQG